MDEQFVGFRRYWNILKPDKFDIKIYMAVDKFSYVYKFEVYAGAQPEGPYQIK